MPTTISSSSSLNGHPSTSTSTARATPRLHPPPRTRPFNFWFSSTDGFTFQDWCLEFFMLFIQLLSVLLGFFLHFLYSLYLLFTSSILGLPTAPNNRSFTRSAREGDGTEAFPHRVVIVGSGFSGLGLAIRLSQRRMRDFVILERRKEVGGTWSANTYPGCACDVPSNLYSFSFEPNWKWSQLFSPQPEIREYLLHLHNKYNLHHHTRYNFDVIEARWNEETKCWRVISSSGSVVYGYNIVCAFGGLSDARYPNIKGQQTFRGQTLHTAEWDSSIDLRNKRIAVIGTGASAIQIIPEIAPITSHLTVYQRTPAWVLTRYDLKVPDCIKNLFYYFPRLQYLIRGALYWGREGYILAFSSPKNNKLLGLTQRQVERTIERQIPNNPQLRKLVTPDYTLGCKRALLHNEYYSSLARDNVSVVTDGITEMKEKRIVTADGKEREVDIIVYATGFHVQRNEAGNGPNIIGRSGLTLLNEWKERMQAHLALTIPNFPNLFFMMGPNSGLGHNSVLVMIEAQIDFILDSLLYQEENQLLSMEVKQESMKRWIEWVDAHTKGSVWVTGGCASWYLDSKAQNTSLFTWFTFWYRMMVQRMKPEDYVFTKKQSKE